MPRLSPDDPRLAAADFPHGKVSGYVKGCSCNDCRRANAEATAARKNRATGQQTTALGSRVLSDRARDHLAGLMRDNQNVKAEHLAKVSGVGSETISRVLRGTSLHISQETERRLLSVDAATAGRVAVRKMLPAGPIVAHIMALLTDEYGSMPAIAAASGIDVQAVWDLHDGRRERVRISTAKAIMSVTPARLRRCAANVSPRIARQRIRALQANGWTLGALNTRLGNRDRTTMTGWLSSETAVIRQATDRAIEALYTEIGDQWGGSDETAKRVRKMGHYPPIHYDEDMRLIPGSIPDRGYSPMTTQQDRARRNLRIMGLTLREYSMADIAMTIGESEKIVERARKMVGLRLESNKSVLADLPYIRPGQDALVALIAEHTAPIAVLEDIDAVDQRGTDHVALWESLVEGAAKLRHQDAPQTIDTAA